MKMIRTYLICCIILCLGLSGCTNGSSDQLPEGIEVEEAEDFPPSVFTQNKADFSQTEENEHNPYLKKIWVANGMDIATYKFPSFFITKMENGRVYGKLSKRSIAEPDCYIYSFDSAINLYNLTGVFGNGAAECQIIGDDESIGNITLVFEKENEIEATIEFIIINGEDALPSGEYRFKPYNLADIESYIDCTKTLSFPVDLNSWGLVNFTTVLFVGKKPYPAAFLTDAQDDILYCFNAPFQTATSIVDVVIEDMNGNGLKDIKTMSGFIDYNTWSVLPDPYVEWIFFQMDNGLFYDSKLNKDEEQ